MRIELFVAALAACIGLVGSASADTLTTTTTSCYGSVGCFGVSPGALQPFDRSLGTLNGITLQISGVKSNELIAHVQSTEQGASGSLTLGYDGTMTVLVNGVSYSFEITSPQQEFSTNGLVFPGVNATGGGTFDLDASLFSSFVDTADQCGNHIGVCAGPPLGDLGIGDVLRSSEGVSISPIVDFYNQANFTLTYIFTAAVPEPSTWAMMLVGFAGMGLAIRRRRREASAKSGLHTG